VLKSMHPKQMVDMIRKVHAGKKCVPAEIASGLAEHVGAEALTNREVEVLQQVAVETGIGIWPRNCSLRGNRQGISSTS
jgi:hypothetical protein